MMKRMLALLLAALLVVLAGCSSEEAAAPAPTPAANPNQAAYETAEKLMVAGDNAGASAAFAALSGYSDAPQMAIYCNGLALAAAGDYDAAVAAFTVLGAFKDSVVKAALYNGVAAQTKAEAALVKGTLDGLETAATEFAAAEAVFAGLPFLPEAQTRLKNARNQRAEIAGRLPALREMHRADDIVYGDGGHFLVKRDGKWGVMGVDGRMVSPCQWDSIRSMYDGLMLVYSGALDRGSPYENCWGVSDLTGNLIVPCEMADVGFMRDLLWVDDAQGERHYYLRDGTPVDPGDQKPNRYGWEQDRIQVTQDRYLVAQDMGWTLVDGSGRVLYADAVGEYRPYCTTKGTIWLASWENGSREVMRIGMISADGEMLLTTDHVLMTPYLHCWMNSKDHDCVILVAPDGRYAAYGPDGERLFDVTWDKIAYGGGGMFGVEQDGLLGLVDMRGQVVVPCIYENISAYLGGFFTAIRKEEGGDDEMLYLLNRKGEILLSGWESELESWSVTATAEYFAWIDDGLLRVIDQQGNEAW